MAYALSRNFYSHSTNDINFPVLPPILPSVLLTLCAAPLRAGPAEEDTLERPCEAFDVAMEAVSFDFAAVSFAASVVEAWRLVVCRAIKPVCRSIKRDGAGTDIRSGRRASNPRTAGKKGLKLLLR